MRNHPFWSISLYKITAIYVVLLNILESNDTRAQFFEKMSWNVADQWHTIHIYLLLLFVLVWGCIYLVEVSFGLTIGAFTLRSRAGVAKWLDFAVLLVIPLAAYGAWMTKSTAPNFSDFERYRFISDADHLFSPYLIWLLVFAGISALQSLGPYGEYRFDRLQNRDADAAPVLKDSHSMSALTHEVVHSEKHAVIDSTIESSAPEPIHAGADAVPFIPAFTPIAGEEVDAVPDMTAVSIAEPKRETVVEPALLHADDSYLASPEAVRFFRDDSADTTPDLMESDESRTRDTDAPITTDDGVLEPLVSEPSTSSDSDTPPDPTKLREGDEDGFVVV